jgi:hypothetical protein
LGTQLPQPQQPRSSWPKYVGIGCLILLAVLIVGGVLAYYGIRSAITGIVAQYSADRPLSVPTVTLSEQQIRSIEERVRAFSDAMDQGTAAQPLELTETEINGIIQRAMARRKPNAEGPRAFVRIVGKRLEGDISVPLANLGSGLEGRYFNGKALISVGVVGDRLVANLEDLKVGDSYVPDELRERLSRENILKDAYDDPEARRLLTRLESVEIGDGKIVLRPKAPAGAASP